ncbi:hypothetical protein IE53DRAFT_409595 [Violaceomyces palustris]|uniref:Uncharacterized protein n=1 Tax=Violaceomyces palustris TaxID=1673888 RepID=A0ACD0P2F7_9BASI|nr:hypothetical protein IE53DRAFT_409595 [Violaceomyces palustris]
MSDPSRRSPSSSASSVSGEIQSLPNNPKLARSQFTSAARAFLQKDHLHALVQTQNALHSLLANKPTAIGRLDHIGDSILDISEQSERDNHHDPDLLKLCEKLSILRLTVSTSVYTHPSTHRAVLDRITTPPSPSSLHHDANLEQTFSSLAKLLTKPPKELIAQLWSEALQLFSAPSASIPQAQSHSLDPTPETLLMALELPPSVVSASIMAALRLDESPQSSGQGTLAARQICEWFLASFSAAPPQPLPTTISDQKAAAYQRVVELYALHLLGSRLGEWEYAREFVGYSSLADADKAELLSRLDSAESHISSRPQRELEAAKAASKAYEEEKSRRAAVEKEQAFSRLSSSSSSLAAAASSSLNRKAGGGGEQGTSSPSSPLSKSGSSKRSRDNSSKSDASSGSDSGHRSGGKSSYFSSSHGGLEHHHRPRLSSSASSSSSTSSSSSLSSTSFSSSSSPGASTATSPDLERTTVSTRGRREEGDGSANGGGGDRGHGRRKSSRSASREKPLHHHPQPSPREEDKENNNFSATRSSVSKYLERRPLPIDEATDGGLGQRDSSRSKRGLLPLLRSTLHPHFSQLGGSTRYVGLTVVVFLFLLYRLLVRSRSSGAGAQSFGSRSSSPPSQRVNRVESAAARRARNQLVRRGGLFENTVQWPLLVWGKVLETIKM